MHDDQFDVTHEEAIFPENTRRCSQCFNRLTTRPDGFCSDECKVLAIQTRKKPAQTLLERLEAKITHSSEPPTPTNGKVFETPCYLWTGAVSGKPSNRYPVIRVKGKAVNAAHVAWVLNRDEPIDGQCVIHACQNSLCVNPDHLFLGTQRDALRNGRGSK